MLVCRSAWQRLAPLTQRSSAVLLRNAPVRQMSSSSVPGSSGDALPYYLFVGAAFVGGGVYVYRTLSRDKARYRERHEYIEEQKSLLNAVKGVTVETREVSETNEEAAEVAIREAATEVVTEQDVSPATSLEQEQPVTEEEALLLPAAEESEVSAEASTEQAEQENTEPVVEAVAAESSPVLEASSDNIPEELESAVEDWSELSARKPEESVEEDSPAPQESEEAEEVVANS